MARPCRLQAADCFYHITSRGDNRKVIYLSEHDREKFLEYVAAAKDKFKFYLHAYCLMDNHFHLFLETTQPNLSRIMQYINTAYTIYYNIKRNKTGHLFQGRYKSILVERDSYFAELTRYIHANPVRAKMVVHPADYRWSSCKAYLENTGDDLVDLERAKQYLGMDLRKYREFMEGANNCPSPFENLYAGFMLGGAAFIKDKLKLLQADVEAKDFAHKRAVKAIIEPETIINGVAECFKISPRDLLGQRTHPQIAKHAALYLLRKKTGLTNARIGDLFNMKHSAVSMAVIGFEKKMSRDEKLKATVEKLNWKFEV